MAAIHYHSAPQRSSPDEHRELHLGSVRETYFCAKGQITNGERRLDDKPLLQLAVGTAHTAQINADRLAVVPHPVPIDREAHAVFAAAGKLLEHCGMERGSPRSGVNLGGDGGQAQLGQADKLAPAHPDEIAHRAQGRIASPSPPSPTAKRRSTLPLA
jgi:hypothetical protein